MRTIGKKIQEKFERFRLWLVRGVAFWNFGSHILTKIKNIRKKSILQKWQKRPSVWPRGSHNQNLKEIRALGSEITAPRTARRSTDEFRFHELCWHSQAELKMTWSTVGDMLVIIFLQRCYIYYTNCKAVRTKYTEQCVNWDIQLKIRVKLKQTYLHKWNILCRLTNKTYIWNSN